jgi:nucleoside-diphosphate-sugar epimerase
MWKAEEMILTGPNSASSDGVPVLVTGAAGFVGSHVTRAILRAGGEVIATDLAAALPDHVTRGLDVQPPRYVRGDLLDEDVLSSIVQESGGALDVVHTAAVIRFSQLAGSLGEARPAGQDFLRSFAVNASTPCGLGLRLHEAGVLRRFLHVSTRAVFGGRPPSTDPVGEDEPVRPVGVYGSSKAAGELALLALRDQFGLDLRIARITGVFGPYQGPVSFIGQAAEAVLAGKAYDVAVGGDDAYELTYVKDTVRGLVMLLSAEQPADTCYHVASGSTGTLREVASAFARAEPAAQVDFGSGHDAGARGRAPLQIRRAQTELGFNARWTLDDALRDYLEVERTGDYGAEAFDPPNTPVMATDHRS